ILAEGRRGRFGARSVATELDTSPAFSPAFAGEGVLRGGRGKHGKDLVLADAALDEGVADAADEHEDEPAVARLLVLAHVPDEAGGIEPRRHPGRKPCGSEMGAHAPRLRLRAKAPPGGELEGERHADRHRLAVEERVREAEL